jgi:predicted ATPase/DNA-binding CsgD family transcriptional regulator
MPMSQRGNLPLEVTSFVGRRREVADVKRLLSASRLVTLVGVGGVGKTRLAQHVASSLHRAFADGVWLVELSSLTSPDLLAETVALRLGVRDETSGDHVSLLRERLAERRLLILLDNCEHILPACAALANDLLQASTGIHIMATSRQPLGLTAEHVLSVSPLTVPDFHALPDSRMLAQYEAVALFAERAVAAEPTFALTPDNAESVAHLCARLDGLPLAIELAAVRLRALSPQQILERLDETYDLLRAENPVTEPRQHTLQALMDWSHGLCSPAEQLLWARAAVFSDGFDLDAAEGVCADEAIPADMVVRLIVDLIDKSIIRRTDNAGQARYQLLETIRDHGRRKLVESGQELVLQQRHLAYYAHLAEQWEDRWFSANDAETLRRLQDEIPNLRSAMAFSMTEAGNSQTGLRLAASLWLSWRASGLIGEGRRWLDRLLAFDEDADAVRAKALWANGWLASLHGDLGPAQQLLDASGALGRRLGDDSVVAYVAQFSGHLAMSKGDVPRAVQLLEQALAAHRAAGNRIGTAITLIRLSLCLSAMGETERARELSAEYLELAQAHHSEWMTSFGHWALSVTTWLAGEVDEAESIARTNVRTDWTHVGQLTTAFTIEVLAWTAAAQGRAERAAVLLGALQQVWQRAGAALPGYAFLVPHHDDCSATARELLGERAFEQAMATGSRMTFDDLVAHALEISPPAAPGHVAADREPLTRRELEVAGCVARGQSNREIASSLVISERTAEGHVQHILVKLGFTSRSQIAAWFAARGEPPGSSSPPAS